MRMDSAGSQLGELLTKLGLVFSNYGLSKESGRTQLAPPDPIFFTQADKNNTYIQCLAMKDFQTRRILSMWQSRPCTSTNPPSQSRIAEGMRSTQDLPAAAGEW